jgi:DNA-directed RNA polymerase specialized sigma24 family protein
MWLHMTQREARRPLTPEAFGKFFRWLSDDDELAVAAYQSIRRRLVRYFTYKACPDPDALFDETIDIVVGKIEAGEEVVNRVAYCYGVAKNVCHQDRRRRRFVSIDRDLVSPEHQEPPASEQALECLERCVNQLSPSDQDVITRYHRSKGSEKIATRKSLAVGFGGMNALRVKVCRIRKALRLCVVDCVKRSTIGSLG